MDLRNLPSFTQTFPGLEVQPAVSEYQDPTLALIPRTLTGSLNTVYIRARETFEVRFLIKSIFATYISTRLPHAPLNRLDEVFNLYSSDARISEYSLQYAEEFYVSGTAEDYNRFIFYFLMTAVYQVYGKKELKEFLKSIVDKLWVSE